MANSCVYIPSKGKNLFSQLRKQFDYSTSRDIFLRAINPKFIEDYKNTLTLDDEGVPTYESLLHNTFMKNLMGLNTIQNMIQNKYPIVEDTRENYNNLLSSAYQFNTSDNNNKDYVAIVTPMDNNKIGITIKRKTDATIKEFENQYASFKLNEKLAQIFSPLGVNINNLTQAEINAGRVGVTDFSVVRDMGKSFSNIIRVANNHEGEKAISEEFSHLIVGIFRNEPLIQRALNTLKSNPEYLKKILGEQDYNDTMRFFNNDLELVAEEVLGHILQKNLLEEQEEERTPSPSLFKRGYTMIIDKFVGYDENEVDEAINSVEAALSTLAKDILEGTKAITESDIAATRREAQFNALSDRIQRNIDILKNSVKTEAKRYKIDTSENKRNTIAQHIRDLNLHAKEDADTVEGIFNYAKFALDALKNLELQFKLVNTMKPKQKFGFLRNVRMYIQSYGNFLEEMQEALNDESVEEDNMFLKEFDTGEETLSVEDIIKDLNQMSKSLETRYFKVAGEAFAEFLKPFMGEKIVVPFGKDAGKVFTIEDLLKEAPSDISFMDRWMQSMADSSDILLQKFDAAVKNANDKTRLECIDRFNRIQEWRQKVENLGITSFEWAFERDNDGNKSGNYISEINHAQFNKELKELLDNLDEKYGKNPSGEKAQAKIAEKNAWLDSHSVSIFGDPQPDPTIYRNKNYDNLTKEQKEVLEEFLSFKTELDRMHPENRVSRLKAIQMRKSGSERFWESVTSPRTLFENIKESIAKDLIDREDDDQIFGERTKRGLTDFSGNEFMVLPVLYTSRLKNPNEISTDLVSTLMAYTYSAVQYKNLDEIVDALEVGKSLVEDKRKVLQTRGENKLLEKFNSLGENVVNKINLNVTNITAKLQDFMESKVYQRYMKDEGVWHVPIIDKDINKGKLANTVLKASSLAQMGFNWLANIANVFTGTCMQNIEAAAGQFFNAKELVKADAAYFKNVAQMTAEANSRTKKNKVSLFFDLFNIKQNFEGKSKRVQTKNWLKRIFGEDIAFLGQELGDHWLYGRTAIAMAMREKVLLDGKEVSLWDALQVQDYNNNSNIKELNYKDIKDLDGNTFDVAKFSRKVAHINQVCFGIYNDEDANAANRVAMGRLLQQYRKWMTIQYSRRFRAGHYNSATDTWEEGYYRTFGRYLRDLKRGGFQFVAQYNKMTAEEQHNIKRAVFELVQFFAVWALANLLDWPDDKERSWALKLSEYSVKRLSHELGGLAPSTVMPQELLKTVKSPLPSASVIQNLFNLANSTIDPRDWVDEMQSGPYKGLSTWEKNFIKAPIPGIAQYRQIDKFVGDLDTSITYYMRPY